MPKKRILFVLPSLEPGGAEYQTIELCNTLQDEYEIYLMVLGCKEKLYEEIKLPQSHIKILGSPFNVVSFKNANIKILFSTLKMIHTFMKEHDIQIVMANLPVSHLLLRVTKLLYPLRSFRLVQIHHSQQFKARKRTLAKKIFDRCNYVLSLMVDDLNIFVSGASLEDSKQYFYYPVSKTIVIHNGVKLMDGSIDTEPPVEIIEKDDIYIIVFAGRLVQEKGHLFFLKALDELLNTNRISKDIALYIIGDGPLYQTISEYIDKSRLEDIYMLGQKPKDELLQFFAAADLVVVPSTSEGFGLVAVEAILTGATVLASDAGGLREIVFDSVNGFTFKSGNSIDLQNSLVHIINDNVKSDPKRAIAYTEERFSFDTMIEEYKKVIDDRE